jgi:tRNA A-37 threonylcarbamoyl transferase component Bud32
MEDPTQLSGNENKTAIKGNTTGGSPKGDFVAGTVLASRYRIINLVGKGGMGEVYKAEDIKLSQMVALKFLPDSYQNDSEMLERFHAEVRNARQVSHVNVCRVFDIGEIDGRHFLSMEFVDGDDLSELLTRVGRFTHERAVEISRQLCVGMEAIHKAGILHRDFKPANIIIDKKGIARITDFGIAGIESEVAKDGIRAGTPAYMAPEQISGREISTRSDIYALGLVIYEIFTGKQAFVADTFPEMLKKHQTETPTNPSLIVKGIDPLVESVIEQCLAKDPKDRPRSALHVAMALPGGNPMQIALDAGQTPSPEMVAASPKIGALRPVVALAMLATVIVGIAFLMITSKKTFLHRMIPLEKSEDALRERGRELMEKFGYVGTDSFSVFLYPYIRDDYIRNLRENDPSPERWQKLATGQPATITFLYRTSPQPIVPVSDRKITISDPENTLPGMAQVKLDTKGRMVFFSGVPERVDEPAATTGEFDWAMVFKEAGFDIAAFQSVDPQWAPPAAFDDRRAFSGAYPDNSEVAIRIEAAAYRGKLVSFQIVEPWTKPTAWVVGQDGSPVFVFVLVGIFFLVLFSSVWLSVRHIRNGRGDRIGAFRIAVFMFAARMLMWAFGTHHVPSLVREVVLFISGLQAALYWAALAGVMYLAFEPYLRKSAPERIISWTRLLSGDWRDPLIGRDVLIGAVVAMLVNALWVLLIYFIPTWQGKPAARLLTVSGQGPVGGLFVGIGGFPDLFFDKFTETLITAFLFSFIILFLGLLLRRKWLGVAAVLLINIVISIGSGFANNDSTVEIVAVIAVTSLLILTVGRFGVVAMISVLLFADLLNRPVTTELSAWYASEFVMYALVLIGLAIFGFYTSTAGQKLWQGKLLGEGD